MRPASLQVRGKLAPDEIKRYDALWEIGKYLEENKQYEYAYVIQKELDLLIQPAIMRLQQQSKERSMKNQDFLKQQENLK